MAEQQRERILQATYDVVARVGMARATMEDVAQQAGLGRATLYRAFPGGRDELLDATVTWEVARFFARVGAAIGPDATDLADVLERGLVAAHDAFAHHEVLQELLRTEADQLLPSLATAMPLVTAALRDWLRPRVAAAEVRPGVDPDEAADLLARTLLSHIGSPGRWDLRDPDQVRRLVRDHLLAGIVA